MTNKLHVYDPDLTVIDERRPLTTR